MKKKVISLLICSALMMVEGVTYAQTITNNSSDSKTTVEAPAEEKEQTKSKETSEPSEEKSSDEKCKKTSQDDIEETSSNPCKKKEKEEKKKEK